MASQSKIDTRTLILFIILFALSSFYANAQKENSAGLPDSIYQDRYVMLTKKSSYYFELERDSAVLELKTILSESTQKVELAESYYLLGSLYTFSTEPDTAKMYLNKAQQLSDEINYRQIKFLSINNLGMIYAIAQNNPEALNYFNQAYREADNLKDTTMLTMTSNNLGIIYGRYELYEEALKWYNKSKQFMELNGNPDSSRICSHLTNMGVLYEKLNMNQKAITTWLEAMNYSKNESSSLFINLSTGYKKIKKYDKALEFAEKAIHIENNNKNKSKTTLSSRINALQVKMRALQKLNRNSEALNYANSVIKIAKKHELNSHLVDIYNFKGEVFVQLKQIDSALIYFKYAHKLLEETENIDQEAETLKNLSTVYELKGNSSLALHYLKENNSINDSIIELDKSKQIEKLKVLINYRDIENENQQLKLENQVKNLKITEAKRLKIALITVLALILIIIGYIIRVYTIKRNQNKKLQKLVDLKTQYLNDEVKNKEKLNKLLKIEKERAEESDRLKSAFLLNMSHEIRTPMNSILGFSDLILKKNLTNEKLEKFAEIINQAGIRLLNTMDDIINISKIHSNLMEISINKVNISEIIKSLSNLFQNQCNAKGLGLEIDENIDQQAIIIQTDSTKVNSIFTNLIKNAIKYTNSGTISIGYKIKDTVHEFFIRDTGIGIEEARQNAIFEKFVQADIEDSNALEGSGLGLAITKSYVNMLGGKIWLESEVGIGSTFFFTLANKKIE